MFGRRLVFAKKVSTWWDVYFNSTVKISYSEEEIRDIFKGLFRIKLGKYMIIELPDDLMEVQLEERQENKY